MLINNSGALIEDASQESQVNFEKLESEYQSTVLKKYKVSNYNASLIKAKRREYQLIKFQIQTHLESNLTLEYESKLKTLYTKIITEYKYQIKIKEQTLECYNNMFARLYKTHYSISRRYDDEMKDDNVRDYQLDQYKNIQTNAIKILKSKKAMLAKITELNDMENIDQYNQLNHKNQIAIQLKARVNILLNNITNEELELNTVNARQDIIMTQIKKVIPLNAKVHMETIINRKDYFRLRIMLYNISKEMQSKNYNQMIELYNTKKFKEKKQLTEFNILNNYIRNYSVEYYHHSEELQSLNKSIIDKRRNESVLNDKIEKAKYRLKYLLSYKAIQIESVLKKHTVLSTTVGYIIKFFNQIYKLSNKPLINANESKIMAKDSQTWGTCLNFFVQFTKTLYNINSSTITKVIEGYFAFRTTWSEKAFECIMYSNKLFISGYKDYYQKISEQYHRMLDIINQSIKNHNEDRKKCSIELPLFNQYSIVRRAYKKRSNILQLSNSLSNQQIQEIKEELYIDGSNENMFPELSFDKENDDEIFKDKKDNTKKVFKKRNCLSDTFANEKELYMYRSNDIRRLKLQYFNVKEKSPIQTQSINEFYQLKTRFNRNQLKRNQKKKITTSYTSTNTHAKNKTNNKSNNNSKVISNCNSHSNTNKNQAYSNNNTKTNNINLYLTEPCLRIVSNSKQNMIEPKVVDIKYHNSKNKRNTKFKFHKSPTLIINTQSNSLKFSKTQLLTYSKI